VHADVRPEAPERVALVLADVAHERLDAVVAVQVFLGGGRARAQIAANRTHPAVGRRTLVIAPLDGQLENDTDGGQCTTKTTDDHRATGSFVRDLRNVVCNVKKAVVHDKPNDVVGHGWPRESQILFAFERRTTTTRSTNNASNIIRTRAKFVFFSRERENIILSTFYCP